MRSRNDSVAAVTTGIAGSSALRVLSIFRISQALCGQRKCIATQSQARNAEGPYRRIASLGSHSEIAGWWLSNSDVPERDPLRDSESWRGGSNC